MQCPPLCYGMQAGTRVVPEDVLSVPLAETAAVLVRASVGPADLHDCHLMGAVGINILRY